MKILKRKPISPKDLDALEGTAEHNDAVRQLRRPLLAAFDKYKTNINYGVITETEEVHVEVVDWYRRLLDLDPTAVAEVPAAILPYV